MSITKRFAIAILLLLISVAASWLVFKGVMDRSEIVGDLIGIASSYVSFCSFQLLSPLRGHINTVKVRVCAISISAIALFIAICLIFEFGIGLAWLTLDKIVRNYQ